MRKLIRSILNKFGYTISREIKETEHLDLLENVFNTNFEKKVLISYILTPFTSEIKKEHSNMLECYSAAQIFHNKEYQIDVVHLFSDKVIDYSKYSIIYGIGLPFENIFYSEHPESILKISYVTGCNPFYSQRAIIPRLSDFYKKTGLIAPSSARITTIPETLQFSMSDLIISLGGEFSRQTHLATASHNNIIKIAPFCFDTYDIDFTKKDFTQARINFLWFGSSGLIHKGLDLLIDIFSQRKDIVLHICGASKSEKKFFDYYQKKIDDAENIINYDFIDIESDSFKKIMDTCAFVVLPSMSEGASVAVINSMANGGLIPLISKATGIDNAESFGYCFDIVNHDNINLAIDWALRLDESELKEKSLFIKQNTKKNYNYENYKSELEKIISAELVKHNLA